MSNTLIKSSYIQLDLEAQNFEEAIVLSMEPLLKDDAITPDYVDEVLGILKETGPYIVITKHIAIPYAPIAAGAKKLAIGFTRLKKPVISCNEANDPVKFLFSLSASTGEEHLQALSDLAFLFSSNEFLNLINEVETKEQLIEFLNNFKGSKSSD